MSRSKKRRYIMYKLCELYKYNKTEDTIVTYKSKYSEYGWVPTRYTREELINDIYYTGNRSEERFKKLLSTDMSEKLPELYGDCRCKYAIAFEYSDGIKLIDYDTLEPDIKAHIKRIEDRNNKHYKEVAANKRIRSYTFRNGPVYYTGNSWRHACVWYRIPKLGNVKRNNCIKEVELREFNNPKYSIKSLSVRDERKRYKDKSWKYSCKVRKQYMKHARRRVDVSNNNWKESWLNELDSIAEEEYSKIV